MQRRDGGAFTISLDLELFWGVHDKRRLESYQRDIRSAREAIPRLLELFEPRAIRSTWAIVGLLFFDNKDELLASLPAQRPQYRDARLSPYPLLDAVGRNEREDPCHFGLSLVRRVQGCPGQEVGTHTFAHYYCLEDGPTLQDFRADLVAAQRAAQRIGITMTTLVFPRNQNTPLHLGVAHTQGLTAYRGNERSWFYRASPAGAQGRLRRAGRLVDSYVPLSGRHCHYPQRGLEGMVEIPSSRLLRRRSPRLRSLEWLRLKRIRDDMDQAGRSGRVFHLWFHPDGFGADVDANLAVVRAILDHFVALRDRYGMQSRHMADLVAAVPDMEPAPRPAGPQAGATC